MSEPDDGAPQPQTRRAIRHDARRWGVQQRLMEIDPESGVERSVLARLNGVHVSSHRVITDDGASLSYKRFGDRGPVIALCNGLGGTYRTFTDIITGLADAFQFVVFDYRGLFESGRPPEGDTLEVAGHARDLFAVLDHARVRHAIVFGWSMGVQVALEAYRQQPDRLQAMIFASGVEGRVLDTLEVVPGSSAVARRATRAMKLHGSRIAVALGGAIRSGPVQQLARSLRLVGRNADATFENLALLLSCDPAVYWTIVERLQAHDASSILPTIAVPVLILHGDSDVLTPVKRGRQMRAQIPDAELRVFNGCTHAVVLEYPERVVRHTREFLLRRLDR